MWALGYCVSLMLFDMLEHLLGVPMYDTFTLPWFVVIVMEISVSWKAGNDLRRWWNRRGVQNK